MNVEINQRFGKLTVVQEVERPVGKSYGHQWVKCKCDCGKEMLTAYEKLRHKQVSSCGCNKKRRGPDHKDWKGCGDISANFYSTYRRGAKANVKVGRKEKEFLVSIEYIWELFLKQNRRCAISGLELTFDPYGIGKKSKETNKVTASLDRINSSIGYVEGNVQWVHKRINIMKNEFPQEEFLEYCRIIAKNNP
jgi:hypothetical protein